MTYLECDKCHQQYELLDGEKPEDFNKKCGCGGQLRVPFDEEEYKKNLPYDFRIDPNKSLFDNKYFYIFMIFGTILLFFVFWPLAIIAVLGLAAFYANKNPK